MFSCYGGRVRGCWIWVLGGACGSLDVVDVGMVWWRAVTGTCERAGNFCGGADRDDGDGLGAYGSRGRGSDEGEGVGAVGEVQVCLNAYFCDLGGLKGLRGICRGL